MNSERHCQVFPFQAQIETQNAALRFERACSQQAAAKEMVYLAEQGFFTKGQPFDPAWQEMLNHATMKVNLYCLMLYWQPSNLKYKMHLSRQ